MNTKKFLFGLFTIFVLVLASCTPNTSEDDQLYDQALDKKDVVIKKN